MEVISAGIHPGYQSESGSSAVWEVQKGKYAITVRHAQIQYKDVVGAFMSGSVPTVHVVLKDFNMTVERGHIYGLLGASGCGKTSLLRAIAGQLDLTAGQIRVLGHEPKSPKSGIPGSTIGYMPQELCLLEEFSIKETLFYYGQLGGMTTEEIDVQTDYLAKLLDLPKTSRIVGTLSGGQQRRVSFAIALLHSPPVLILDEPTVGVDPLLRESIWDYLTKLVKTNGTTVLITTHYIEEATQADVVGLMRHGKLMAEQNPISLIRLFNCTTLEDVLLKLCLNQSTREKTISSVIESTDLLPKLPKVNDDEVDAEPLNVFSRQVSSTQKICALVWKDTMTLIRHYWFSFVMISLPLLITSLYCGAIGSDPKGLHISVFNEEVNCYSNGVLDRNRYSKINDKVNCTMPTKLSCRMLRILEDMDFVTEYSESATFAEAEVRRGHVWAAIMFHQNFSNALMGRAAYVSLADIEPETIEQGTVRISMDSSSRVISVIIQSKMVEVLRKLMGEIDDVCHNLMHAKDLPLQYKPPVYGTWNLKYRDFGVPGIVTSFVFMSPLTLTLCFLLPEKIRGTLERSLVSGVTMSEVILSQCIVCVVPVVLIIFCSVIVPYEFYGLMMIGSYWTIFIMMIFLSLCGMMAGYVLALICNKITTASLTGMGFYFTCLFGSGCLWPVEGASPYLRFWFYIMPLTYPTTGLRDVTNRGWSLFDGTPQISILVTFIWSLIFVIVIAAILRLQR